MSAFHSRMIDAYRCLSWPVRKLRLQQLKKEGQVPIAVMFYHRVDDQHPNSWTISNHDFEQQINWMHDHFDLVSLEECQRRIRSGYNDRPTLSITFDDGYADNCNVALPLLIEKSIPVTYFVTTHQVFHGQPFEHDLDSGRPLPLNNVETLKALVAAGVEIGGHNRHHIDLGPIRDPAVLYDQVITASRELGEAIGQRIRYFAFPYGQPNNLNRDVFDLLHHHGFEAVCSAYGGFNAIGSEAFHLQRMHGDPNFARIRNWLTYDPRLSFKTLYQYQRPAEQVSPNTERESADTSQLVSQSH